MAEINVSFMLEIILETFRKLNFSRTIWIAYSGGVDSHVLLHAASQLQTQFPEKQIKAIHIHHGLYSEADQWVEHCQQVCDALNIPLKIRKVKIKRLKKHSLEALARKARYQVFAEIIQDNDILLTAHHQDDQAETCLMQLLRGSGVRGLASMPAIYPFKKGFLVRPFLSVSRQEILNYAKANHLNWVEDLSNQDTQFTRNFLRHRVMPILKEHWPVAEKTIARVAEHAAETKLLLEELAREDLCVVKSDVKNCLSIKKLLLFSLSRQKNILRVWLHEQGFLLPSTKKLEHIVHDVVHARADANPCVSWEQIEVRRYQDNLYVMPILEKHDASIVLSWEGKSSLTLPFNLGTLIAKRKKGKGIHLSKKMTVRFRQPGDFCYFSFRKGKQSLKKLFQEWQIPVWQRDRIPLIFMDDQLAQIVGYAICDGFAVSKNERGLDIIFES